MDKVNPQKPFPRRIINRTRDARASSILKKIKRENNEVVIPKELHLSELKLIRTLMKFPSIVTEATERMKPHKIPYYLQTLSSNFNKFYRDCPVVETEYEWFRKELVISTSFPGGFGIGFGTGFETKPCPGPQLC